MAETRGEKEKGWYAPAGEELWRPMKAYVDHISNSPAGSD